MKKIISFILTMIMLLTCTSISVMAADTQSDTTNQDGKMTIGVSVYNLNDAEVRAFRNYFENYVGMAFDVEFLYSSSISTAEEEISFINELHERNVKGIISFPQILKKFFRYVKNMVCIMYVAQERSVMKCMRK